MLSLNKNELRSIFLQRRLACSPREIQKKSAVIEKKFLKFLSKINPVSCVSLYCAFKQEVQTAHLFKILKARKIKIVCPPVNGKKKMLDFCSVKKIDLVILPGVVFDHEGYRLGYGKGYYDRFLSHAQKIKKNIKTVGLAFEFQMIKKIPADPWDKPVDMIITEKKVYGKNFIYRRHCR